MECAKTTNKHNIRADNKLSLASARAKIVENLIHCSDTESPIIPQHHEKTLERTPQNRINQSSNDVCICPYRNSADSVLCAR